MYPPSASGRQTGNRSARRLRYNFALDRAMEHCRDFRKPLLILEALRCGYPWSSDRIHAFVIEGMNDNAAVCERSGVSYYPYLEPAAGAGQGLLEGLAERACVVVTDDFPCFFLPRMVSSAAARLPVQVEAVDSNGLLPLGATDKAFARARDFRRFLQRSLPALLGDFPRAEPFRNLRLPGLDRLPGASRRWRPASRELLGSPAAALGRFPIDHSVGRTATRGGSSAAAQRLETFLKRKLAAYGERNAPDEDVSSGLSPYLHFGHLSVHEVFAGLARREKWREGRLSLRALGSREGWWRMSRAAESFLDEVVTWRELGYNFAAHREEYDKYRSLPEWARKTLEKHRQDRRTRLYTLELFERGETHDALWNAAETQLVREGRMHTYLRMLWGKKILEWSKSPEEAARTMIHLNNKYALDGRDPNSYSGIFWVLGRYDRPWAPERPVYGVVRYMSSENTARKFPVKGYLRKYARGAPGPPV